MKNNIPGDSNATGNSMSTTAKLASFSCPHNPDVFIIKKCCITECPFHTDQVSQLFTLETIETQCIFYDTDMMANVSDSRTQISALSRDKRRTVSPKNMRSLYEDALLYMKTLYDLTHKVGSYRHTCTNCGYPTGKGSCMSKSICSDRREWTQFVLSLYNVEDTFSKRQLVWELLLGNQIHLEDSAKHRGISFCSSKDVSKITCEPIENTA